MINHKNTFLFLICSFFITGAVQLCASDSDLGLPRTRPTTPAGAATFRGPFEAVEPGVIMETRTAAGLRRTTTIFPGLTAPLIPAPSVRVATETQTDLIVTDQAMQTDVRFVGNKEAQTQTRATLIDRREVILWVIGAGWLGAMAMFCLMLPESSDKQRLTCSYVCNPNSCNLINCMNAHTPS